MLDQDEVDDEGGADDPPLDITNDEATFFIGDATANGVEYTEDGTWIIISCHCAYFHHTDTFTSQCSYQFSQLSSQRSANDFDSKQH
jgi:hypothetical protein